MNGKVHGFKFEGVSGVTITNCQAYGGDVGFGFTNVENLSIDGATHWSSDALVIIANIQQKVIDSSADPEVKKELIEKFRTAIHHSDKKSALAIYDNLIASAANHIAVLGGAWDLILSFKQHLS